MYLVF